MLQVQTTKVNESLKLTLAGTVDESDDLKKIIGSILMDTPIIINCKGISRINSLGVKKWIQFFGELSKMGAKLVFEEVSGPLIENLNMITNFLGTGKVTSAMVPYLCSKCRHKFAKAVNVDEIKKSNFSLPSEKCEKCSAASNFDDIPEEYFAFLQR